MKKQILILIVLIAGTLTCNAQRHLKGISGIDAVGGITSKGFFCEAGYFQYLTAKSYFTIPVRIEVAKIDGYNLNSISLNPSYNYTLWKPTEWMFINLKAGGSAYYDMRSKTGGTDSLLISTKTSSLNFGLFGGVEIETYLSDRVVFLVNFRQNYNFKSYPGNTVWYAGAGLRFNLF